MDNLIDTERGRALLPQLQAELAHHVPGLRVSGYRSRP
jgi:hypothetical protein